MRHLLSADDRPRLRSCFFGVVFCLVLGACGSTEGSDGITQPADSESVATSTTADIPDVDSDDTSDVSSTTESSIAQGTESANESTTMTSVEPEDGESGETNDEGGDTTAVQQPEDGASSTVDVRAALEIFVGIEDVDLAVECIEREVEDAGAILADVIGQTGFIVVVARCEKDALRGWIFADLSEIDSSAVQATPQQIDCTLDSFVTFLGELDFAGPAPVLDAAEAPREVVDRAIDECSVSEDDAVFLLSHA